MFINIFKNKNDEELAKLYGQFREVEQTGFFSENELGEIAKEYQKVHEAKTLIALQLDITHAVADRWLEEQVKRRME